jgi:methylmalonyl-CoA epimerase
MHGAIISHVGIAVSDLEEAARRYELMLGVPPSLISEVADQKVRVAMFAPSDTGEHGGGRVELLAATSPDSPIARFIDKRGEGLHHICIYVDDIDQRLEQFKSNGVRLIDETPRIGAEGARIAFVHPQGSNGVLIELEERTG